jgi:hypothetical protein
VEIKLSLVLEQKIQEGLRVEIEKTKESSKKITALMAQLMKEKEIKKDKNAAAPDLSSVI